MKKIIVSTLVIGLLLTTSVVSMNARICRPYIYVDDDNTQGPWDGTLEHPFQYIQDGVDAAENGDIVYVFGGTYYENLIVNKSIDLFGEDRETTFIDGMNLHNTVFIKKALSVSIRGFTVINCINDEYKAGININRCTDVSVSNCIIKNNGCGIRVAYTDTADISNCIINNNLGLSIYIISSSQVNINQCEIHDNGEPAQGGTRSGGIVIWSDPDYGDESSNIDISHCDIKNNLVCGVSIEGGSSDVSVHHNTICGNTDQGDLC